MKTWDFENGVIVTESCCVFSLYYFDEFCGNIYQQDADDFKECCKILDNGIDPVEGQWEDGLGNPCEYYKWIK